MSDKKPSERIMKIAKENSDTPKDLYVLDMIYATIQYLDEEWEGRQGSKRIRQK